MSEKKQRGGYRPGAGRRPGSIKQVVVSLDALRAVGLDVSQREYYADEWFVNGTHGPFSTAGQAVIEGVKRLVRSRDELEDLANNRRGF